jgi:hypothetical protein
MRNKLGIALLVASQFLVAALAWGQGAYKVVETGGPDAGIPAATQAVLVSQGVTFENAQGASLCEIWWRKGIPVTQAPPSASGDVLYTRLTVGEFVGVIHVPKTLTDYRGQAIKEGDYTLRYALIPQDGNHMGVSTYRDFLLLIPVADDPNPSQTMAFDQVVKASRLTTGTGHPAVLMLAPVGQNAKFPSAIQDDQGNWTLNSKLDTSSGGQLPFAVILVGQYQG